MTLYTKKVEELRTYEPARLRDGGIEVSTPEMRSEEFMRALHGSALELAQADYRAGKINRDDLVEAKDMNVMALARDLGVLREL